MYGISRLCIHTCPHLPPHPTPPPPAHLPLYTEFMILVRLEKCVLKPSIVSKLVKIVLKYVRTSLTELKISQPSAIFQTKLVISKHL